MSISGWRSPPWQSGARPGARRGRPSLNEQLAAAGLLDELCLTLSPLLVGGGAKRIPAGPELVAGPGWDSPVAVRAGRVSLLRYRPRYAG